MTQKVPFRTDKLCVRKMKASDIAAALVVQSNCYPGSLQENEEAFVSRLLLPSSYCLVASEDDRLLGYLLAHGWAAGSPPAVGDILKESDEPEVLYVHDLAVASAGRGREIGGRLLTKAIALAVSDGFERAELIGIEGAIEYWRKKSFVGQIPSPDIAEKVASYGPGARFMCRSLLDSDVAS